MTMAMRTRFTLPFVMAAVLACASAWAASAFAADDDEPPPLSPPGMFFAPTHFRHEDGAMLFRTVCQGCHMPDARGAQGAGMYPALAANPRLASATYPATVVLHGRHGMPPFDGYMSDAQVAAIVNYVRTHFDNHYTDALSADDVAKLRASAGAGVPAAGNEAKAKE
jgi:mono/diheme cytochrome c family protein